METIVIWPFAFSSAFFFSFSFFAYWINIKFLPFLLQLLKFFFNLLPNLLKFFQNKFKLFAMLLFPKIFQLKKKISQFLHFFQIFFRPTKILCQWLKILSSDGNIKTYVGGWQPCYDLCVAENSYNVICV